MDRGMYLESLMGRPGRGDGVFLMVSSGEEVDFTVSTATVSAVWAGC